VAGAPLALELALSDGATGQPVDDLAAQHDALLHLIVIGDGGAFFAHLHPARVAAGRYRIALTPSRPGAYTAYAEVARRNAGPQLVARPFAVAGDAAPAAAPPPGLGPRQAGGLSVTVGSARQPLRAGEPSTLTLDISEGGRPVADLQPWLGMGGHLIVLAADGATVGHVHAAGPMAPAGAAVRYGPRLSFVYSFPQPGAYRLWAQFQRAGEVVTVPIQLTVAP
jgi:hypothetical protein